MEMENDGDCPGQSTLGPPYAKPKTRSLSDSDSTPHRLSPSPHIIEAARQTSKDDSGLHESTMPKTPRRPAYLSMPPLRASTPPQAAVATYVNPTPLSPQLDQSHSFASPILPRRSRGLDFSRAATSLHHSTLAEQSSPDSSPTMGGKAMNIPARRNVMDNGPEQTSSSLWSMMGNQEKMNLSHSLGSNTAAVDSSSSDDDLMDEDMDDAYMTTPQVSRSGPSGQFGSPAMGGLVSFQQRQRKNKAFNVKKRGRGPIGLGFNNSGGSSISNSPPSNAAARRESISWQANQLHISNMDADDKSSEHEGMSSDGQRNVVRRPVTRRGNLLPKTKTFARIRAALFEEGAPAEAECKREAEVVKQVRESDVPDLEPRRPAQPAQPATSDAPPAAVSALSSPNQESLDDIPEDDMMGDLALGLSSSFKQHALRNSKGKTFWDTFSETSSVAGPRTTPPPPGVMARRPSSGRSEDVTMDSPLQQSSMPWLQTRHLSDSQRSDSAPAAKEKDSPAQPPTAAEITRRINNKRRRDDDFDPVSFKRRAVSPGLSVHNSPLPQSPMQQSGAPWGSRPGSNGGDKAGSSAPSESGGSTSGNRTNGKGRVGYQGMHDTHDGLMRMSIE